MPLKIHIRRLNFVTNTCCTPMIFGLEEYGIENKSNSFSQRHVLTCGINMNTCGIGTRFVANDGYVVPLSYDETQSRLNFMAQRGLSRTASVYYSLTECGAFARLSITYPDKRVPSQYRTHLSLYKVPNTVAKTNELICKDIALPPNVLNSITQQMLMCLKGRNIIPLAG